MMRHFLFGVSTPGGGFGLDEVTTVAEACGVSPTAVLWYEDFAAEVPMTALRNVLSTGRLPLVTWEPWLWRTDDVDAADSIIGSIIAGDRDDHLTGWARGLSSVGHDVQLRFGHEFNGDWYPWSPAAGVTPTEYVTAWRHVHRCFRDHGVTNVRWMWSPSAGVDNLHPLEAWYPGDDYVDVVGIDGYNWGTTQAWSRWTDPADLFGPTVAETRRVTDGKPMVISEVGCAEAGGDKAEWITDFVRWVAAEPDVSGFVWFEHDKETDWRIASTPRSATTMASALSEVFS
ncbi:glycoside hydrolase family 26 protein [Mycolicibacterium sp. F2034L]|uniref:glycoside hydrolase family 26 protein n=1 Tax=Mycolicibacterium sp. F2034L TaxID=2926422 RepID=UPI001FF37DB9|nr:glycosyl hydrolase [Mycolicibacterium sp. F2034L]MCK0177299.1 endoglucanase [Mycolicibacterium sp. F2034L]